MGREILSRKLAFFFVFGFGLGVSSGPHQIDLAVSVSLVENDCLGGLQTVKNTETLKRETPVGRAGRIFFLRNLGRIYDSFSLYPRRPGSFLAKESTTSQNNTSFFGPLLFLPVFHTPNRAKNRVSCLFFSLSEGVLVFSLPQLDDSEGGQPGLTGRWTISAFFLMVFVRIHGTALEIDRQGKQHSQQPTQTGTTQGGRIWDVTYQLLSLDLFLC